MKLFSHSILISFFTFFFIQNEVAAAKVFGQITDSKGEPLPYSSVYVKGSTKGTTSNEKGFYSLELAKGTYEIIFQYIGYQQVIKTVTLQQTDLELNVTLLPQSVELTEIVVSANAEDPAYAIIRKAIEKRKYYKEKIKSFACDVYIKGNQKLLDAPMKLLGEEIGDLDGSLDSNRQGIVYLSESVSKFYYQAPNDYREEMISSKVSGNDNGFSFNQARAMNFDFYENYINLGRPLVSPIADPALDFYRYKLLGTFSDESKRLVNKIQVLPKNPYDPVFEGVLYITEDLWNIYSTELYATKNNTKIQLLDTVAFRQIHLPVDETDAWRIFSQTIEFRLGLLGFDLKGNFTGVFRNYNLQPTFTKGFFSNEMMVVQDSANQKSEAYWEEIRPVPLTVEEQTDYVRKDSIRTVRSSVEYLDSIDRISNRFEVMDILTGYTYSKTAKRSFFRVAPPLYTVQFNTVQGFTANLDMTYRKEFDEWGSRYLELKPLFQFGFSDLQPRGVLDFTFQFNEIRYTRWQLTGGRQATQLNANEPISAALNTTYSLWIAKNYLKLYDKFFVKTQLESEIFNGATLQLGVEYAERRPLVNTTTYTLRPRTDRIYEPNEILDNPNFDFQTHQAFIIEAALRLRFGQKYLSYPNRKIRLGSKYPILSLFYKKGIPTLGSDADFDWAGFELTDRFQIKTAGESSWRIAGGLFLNDTNVQFPDFQHFNGNQTLFGNPRRYLETFNLLSYYSRSTTLPQVQAHYQHNFEGFLLDKIPVIKKLGFSTVVGAHALYTQDAGLYYELNFGLDRIGWKMFRFLRLDYYFAFDETGYLNSGLLIGLKISAEDLR